MYLKVESTLDEKFPGIVARMIKLRGIEVKREDPELETFKDEIIDGIKGRWALEQLREHPIFRAYRDFFWRVGVDPTKTRPASEALIRRVLRGRPLPRINTFVDAYNLASMESTVPLAGFDLDGLSGELLMREASAGEEFLGIGMEKPTTLKGGEIVVEDNEKLVAIYPYRDADVTKITVNTDDVMMLICGVPNIDRATLARAEKTSLGFVTRFCGGSTD